MKPLYPWIRHFCKGVYTIFLQVEITLGPHEWEVYTVNVSTPRMFTSSVVSMYPEIVAYKIGDDTSTLSIMFFNPTLTEKNICLRYPAALVHIEPVLDIITEV